MTSKFIRNQSKNGKSSSLYNIAILIIVYLLIDKTSNHKYQSRISFLHIRRQNLNGQNLLEKLYADPKRWSFQFQSYIQLTRLQELKAPMKEGKTVRLLERSIKISPYLLSLAYQKMFRSFRQ